MFNKNIADFSYKKNELIQKTHKATKLWRTYASDKYPAFFSTLL